MMPCLSASRGYRPSPTSTTSSSSDTKSKSISTTGSEISSTLFVSRKRPRTRRKRPQQTYNEAAAALSAIYPKIFSEKISSPRQKKVDSKFWKRMKPLRFKEEGAELFLQEVPTLIGGRVREVEKSEYLCNEGTPPKLKCEDGVGAAHRQVSRLLANDNEINDSKSMTEFAILSSSPSWDARSMEFECFLDSSDGDIDGGIMSTIMGSDTNPESSETEDGLGLFGLGLNGNVEQGSEYSLHCSAIRALRRTADCMFTPVLDYSFPRLRLSDKIMADKERNAMFFCSLEWLKKDDAQQRLKLKLNYEDVLNAWSDRGPLYTDEVPDDSYSDPMATSMNFDVVPDLGFWRTAGNIFYGQVEDRSSVVEDGMINSSGVREASVLRYKEKRRTRLFSKKIRYEVRKLNAERRPRMKGRFVRRLADL